MYCSIIVTLLWFFYTYTLVININKVSSIIHFIIFILLLILVGVVWVYQLTWRSYCDACRSKMTYGQFIKLYEMMPKKFTLDDYYIEYDDYRVDFKTFIDFCRYKIFRKCKQNREIKLKQIS